MSEPASLEHGYRRLLAAYPRAFRSERGEEMLAVLMAGARPGQRRPGLIESWDVLRSAVGMRLRRAPAGLRNQEWGDALALFSVTVPLFLLAADVLEVVFPYRVPVTRALPGLLASIGRHPEVGGLSLLRVPFFGIAVGCQVIIAVLILLGLRWLALAAIAACAGSLFAASHWIDWVPHPLQLLTAAGYLLTAAALSGSPSPRRGRQLLSWRHGLVLLLLAGAVQASTLWYATTSPLVRILSGGPPHTWVYAVIGVVLAVGAVTAAVAVRVNRYFLLLLAALFYPYVMQLAYPANSSNDNLLGHPTPRHLAVLFVPPLLAAGAAVLTAAARWRATVSPGPGETGLA
jgi:hypothetical protein